LSRLAVVATGALRRLYTPGVERASRRLRVHDLLVRVHDGLWRWLITAGYLLSDDRVEVSVGGAGALFRVSSRAEYERATTLIGEREVLSAFLADLGPDDTVWDVGANVGLYACLAADVVGEGAVVAFEPHPENADRLRANLRLNGRHAAVDTRALSDREATATLRVVGDDVGTGGHTLRRGDETTGTVEVPLVRGDALVESGAHDPPTVLKIDVEGAELDVLRGLREALARPRCRVVYVEVHRGHGVAVDDATDLLSAAGFDVERLQERGSTTFLRATRPSPGD
jgi:FkbM family methyltransferase